jgi:hypothetical protein
MWNFIRFFLDEVKFLLSRETVLNCSWTDLCWLLSRGTLLDCLLWVITACWRGVVRCITCRGNDILLLQLGFLGITAPSNFRKYVRNCFAILKKSVTISIINATRVRSEHLRDTDSAYVSKSLKSASEEICKQLTLAVCHNTKFNYRESRGERNNWALCMWAAGNPGYVRTCVHVPTPPPAPSRP